MTEETARLIWALLLGICFFCYLQIQSKVIEKYVNKKDPLQKIAAATSAIAGITFILCQTHVIQNGYLRFAAIVICMAGCDAIINIRRVSREKEEKNERIN